MIQGQARHSSVHCSLKGAKEPAGGLNLFSFWYLSLGCCCCVRSVRTNLTQNGQLLLCSPCVNAHELFLSSSSQESSSQSRVLSVQKRVLIFSFWMSRRCHLPQCHPRRGDATSPCWSEPKPPGSVVWGHVHFVGSVGSAGRHRKAISNWLAQIVKVIRCTAAPRSPLSGDV